MDETIGSERFGEGYFSILRRAILRLPENTRAARRELYQRIETAQRSVLMGRQPPYDEASIDVEFRLFRYATRIIEEQIRGGADIGAPDYQTPSLDAMRERIFASRDQRLSQELATAQTSDAGAEANVAIASPDVAIEEPATMPRLAEALSVLAAETQRTHPGGIGTIRAVTIHQLQLVASEGRFALLWLLIQPAILVMLIMAMYFLLATNFILNMDVPTFALLGSTTWIMCRQTILRVSQSFLSGRLLLNLPGVTPLHVSLGQGLVYLFIYGFVFLVLLLAGHLVELTTLPDNPLGVVGALVGMWLFALFLGILFGSIAVAWPFFLRFSSVIERALQLFSSVFFVSEQLPEEYRHYVLWCPTAHGMQILRDQYFSGYVSADASLLYFLSGLIVIGAGSLVVYAARRADIHPQ